MTPEQHAAILDEVETWFRRYAGASLTAIARQGPEKAEACAAGAAALRRGADALQTAEERIRALQAEPSDLYIRACLEGTIADLRAQLDARGTCATCRTVTVEGR